MKNKFIFAQIIVTDFSWALINSIHQAFNNTSVVNYLNWTYNLLIDDGKVNINILKNMMLVRHHLCATHFLRIIIKRAKKVSCDENCLKTFIYSFTLIQNAVSLKQFEANLVDIFHIFNQLSQNQFYSQSMSKIQSEL